MSYKMILMLLVLFVSCGQYDTPTEIHGNTTAPILTKDNHEGFGYTQCFSCHQKDSVHINKKTLIIKSNKNYTCAITCHGVNY